MSNSAIAFLAGLGSGYLKAKDQSDQDAQKKTQQDLQNQLIQQRIDANAAAQAAQAKLSAAGAPATVDPNAATLDTGAGPKVYQMPAGINSQGVAQSDAMQFRDLQANDPTVAPTTPTPAPVVATPPSTASTLGAGVAPSVATASPVSTPIATPIADPTQTPPASAPIAPPVMPASGAPGPITNATNAVTPAPAVPVAPAGTTAPFTPVIGNTAAVNGVGYANPTDAALAAGAYNDPQARAQRIIQADASVNPVQSLQLQQQNVEFQQKQLAQAQLLQKEGVFNALAALRTGDVQGMVSAFNGAGGAKIVGGAAGVQLTPSTRVIPGLGTIPDYTATFMLKNADGSVTPRTINAFDASLQTMPLQALLKQGSDNMKNTSDAALNSAKVAYYGAETAKAGQAGAPKDQTAAWQKAAMPAPAVVNVADPSTGKDTASPDLTVAYQTLFQQARGQTNDPIQASQLANAAVLKIRNGAQAILAAAQTADPKTAMTMQQAIQQTIKNAAAYAAANAPPRAPVSAGNGSSGAANGGNAAMRTAASGDMGPNINALNYEIRQTQADLQKVSDAPSRAALQAHLTAMISQKARYLAGNPQSTPMAAAVGTGRAPPAAAPPPAPYVEPHGLLSHVGDGNNQAPVPAGVAAGEQQASVMLGDGGNTTVAAPPPPVRAVAPSNLGDDFTSPGAKAALAALVKSAKMGGPPLNDVQRLRARQVGLIS